MAVNATFAFVLEYVTDVAAARSFYEDQLGLTITRDHPSFVQFADARGVAFAIASDDPLGDGSPELYWEVADVEAAYAALAPTQEITLPLQDLPFGKAFGVKDPAGQPQYLLTFAQQRPSQEVS